jgi:hypothetical protein
LVLSKTLTETNAVWNVHRVWIYFASPLVGLLLRAILKGKREMGDWHQLLLFAVLGFIVTWAGTFLINLVRVPRILHAEREQALSRLETETSQLKAQQSYNEIAKVTRELQSVESELQDYYTIFRPSGLGARDSRPLAPTQEQIKIDMLEAKRRRLVDKVKCSPKFGQVSKV